MNHLYLVCILSLTVFLSHSQNTIIISVELTVEYLENPSGLDIEQPRLSWKISSAKKNLFNQKQSAYRILVSDNKKDINKNRSNIWDSDWILSDKIQLIEFNGNRLTSDNNYFWKVQIKDEQNKESKFSEVAQWSTGLFSQDEWTASWIGTDEEYKPEEGSNQMKDPWFRKTFTLNEKPARANLFVASVGYHEVFVNGEKIGDHVLAPAATDHTTCTISFLRHLFSAANR